MSDTPRTDAAAFHTSTNGGLLTASVVTVDVAIKLERELNAAKAEIAQRTAEVAKSNAERDEARRKWCELASAFSASIITAEGLAKERGWDCFDAEGDKTC
jgi:hypothetical protein